MKKDNGYLLLELLVSMALVLVFMLGAVHGMRTVKLHRLRNEVSSHMVMGLRNQVEKVRMISLEELGHAPQSFSFDSKYRIDGVWKIRNSDLVKNVRIIEITAGYQGAYFDQSLSMTVVKKVQP